MTRALELLCFLHLQQQQELQQQRSNYGKARNCVRFSCADRTYRNCCPHFFVELASSTCMQLALSLADGFGHAYMERITATAMGNKERE